MKIDYLKIKTNYIKTYFRQVKNPDVLFVWIPKTAGTSMYNTLNSTFNMELYLTYVDAKNSFVNRGMASFGHMSIKALLEQGVIDGKYLDKAFVYAVCRNPYDRFVSLLHYLRHTERIPKTYQAIDLIQDVVKGVDPVGLYNYRGISQCNTQVAWLEGFNVDKVFKFEHLATEIKALEQLTGKVLQLNHDNQTQKRKQAREELDNQTVKMIREYYEADFKRFNYPMAL